MRLNVKRLKEALQEREVNQTWLAEQLGVHRATISIWIHEPYRLKLDIITDMANALDIDPKQLIGY